MSDVIKFICEGTEYTINLNEVEEFRLDMKSTGIVLTFKGYPFPGGHKPITYINLMGNLIYKDLPMVVESDGIMVNIIILKMLAVLR